MKRIVINEMRAYRSRLKQLNITCMITATRPLYKKASWEVIAVAYNPETKHDVYLIKK